jgi:membrane protein
MKKKYMNDIFKRLINCLSNSVHDTIHHDGIEHAGYLAFLLMLTIFPFLVFFVAIVGFFGKQDLSEALVKLLLESQWANFIDALKPRIIEITSSPPQGLLTIAIISAIWTASSIFEGSRTALNKAYRVTSTPSYILRRLLSFIEFAAVIVTTVLLLVVLIVIPLMWSYIFELFKLYDHPFLNFISPSAEGLRYLILLIFGFTIISGLYYYLPNRKQKLIWTFPGTVTVLFGWAGASSLFRLYLSYFPSINLIYGSIAGVIIALLYFYICSLIFIIGAEINHHFEVEFKK